MFPEINYFTVKIDIFEDVEDANYGIPPIILTYIDGELHNQISKINKTQLKECIGSLHIYE